MEFIKKCIWTLLEWFTRRRSAGIACVKYGTALLLATLALDLAAQVRYDGEHGKFELQFSFGQGLPGWAVVIAYGLGCVLFLVGLGILLCDYVDDRRGRQRRRLFILELRGLHASPDTPIGDAVLPEVKAQRHQILLDFRPQLREQLVDPGLALQKVMSFPATVTAATAATAKADVSFAVGGLAAVPALFLTGALLDDESQFTLFDWDRTARVWRRLDGDDDGVRFQAPLGIDSLDGAEEVVLVVEASYAIEASNVTAAFGEGLPVVRLSVAPILADRFWSEKKQAELTVEFRDTLQALMGRGVKRIHLLLAAPSSLCIRMGSAYDERLMPELLVYQFERTASPPYPWAFRVPSHGQAKAEIVDRSAANFTASSVG